MRVNRPPGVFSLQWGGSGGGAARGCSACSGGGRGQEGAAVGGGSRGVFSLRRVGGSRVQR